VPGESRALLTSSPEGATDYVQADARDAAFFAGLDPVEPGIVSCPEWRPDPDEAGGVRKMDEFCALGRK
jgi:hypothetical protein